MAAECEAIDTEDNRLWRMRTWTYWCDAAQGSLSV